MRSKEELKKALKAMFASQYLAVLATQREGQPYTNLIAFVATDDLRFLLFATGRSTRKYTNITLDSRASMLIDNRSNEASDVAHAMAATATGSTETVPEDEMAKSKALYLSKHPHLEGFLESPSTVLVRMNVTTYYVVNRFQEVTELHIKR